MKRKDTHTHTPAHKIINMLINVLLSFDCCFKFTLCVFSMFGAKLTRQLSVTQKGQSVTVSLLQRRLMWAPPTPPWPFELQKACSSVVKYYTGNFGFFFHVCQSQISSCCSAAHSLEYQYFILSYLWAEQKSVCVCSCMCCVLLRWRFTPTVLFDCIADLKANIIWQLIIWSWMCWRKQSSSALPTKHSTDSSACFTLSISTSASYWLVYWTLQSFNKSRHRTLIHQLIIFIDPDTETVKMT